ncbi:hypothetical protein Tco_0825324 [Tanacetum coccineum]
MAKASPTPAWLASEDLLISTSTIINCFQRKEVKQKESSFKSKTYSNKEDVKICFIWTYVVQCGGSEHLQKEYSTQSKGYHVYNKRTWLIVKSIHLIFDEIKETSETSVANDTSDLVPQRQKALDSDNPDPALELQNVSPSANTTVPSQQDPSSPTDDSAQQDTLPSTNIHPTTEPSTPTHVNAEENNNDQAKFTNPFCTPVQENDESSSRNICNSNVHTFNQPQDSEYRWTKDHPLTQVHGNPSKPVQTG